ncbi:MAG: hypothetical protein C5B49_09665 [Bdellovibrio sp.]|nr:MAG: hypothetical protein C5B49_09665 [Bdellovibrio sp.]
MRVPLLFLKLGASIFLICLVILYIGHWMGGRTGLLAALALTIAWTALLWATDESHWMNLFDLHRIEGQDPWGILSRIEFGAQRLHMELPEFYVVRSRSAFVLSLTLGSPRDVLLISERVLEHLDIDETQALLLSELASLWLRQRLRYRWFHWLALSMVTLGELMDRAVFWSKIQFFTRTLTPMSRLFLKLVTWHRFEEERDRLTISIVSDRRKLASALWKLKSIAQAYPLIPPAGSEHLFSVFPSRNDDEEQSFLSVQSSLSSRLRRIVGTELV